MFDASVPQKSIESAAIVPWKLAGRTAPVRAKFVVVFAAIAPA
jgi:hypothetical protein